MISQSPQPHNIQFRWGRGVYIAPIMITYYKRFEYREHIVVQTQTVATG